MATGDRKPGEKHLPFKANLFGNVAFTINAENTDTITVNLQFKDHNNNEIGIPVSGRFYIADDSIGLDVAATALSGGFTAGTDGSVSSLVTGKQGLFNTEADGDLDLNLIHSGAKTCYLVVVLPSGGIVVSNAITFAA